MYLPKDSGECRLWGLGYEVEEWAREQPGVDRGLATQVALQTMVFAVGDRIYVDWTGEDEFERRSILYVAPAVPNEDPRFKALNDAFCRMVGAVDPDALTYDVYFRSEGKEALLWVTANEKIDNPNGPETAPDSDLVARLKALKCHRRWWFNVRVEERARELLRIFGAAWATEALSWPVPMNDDRAELLILLSALEAIDDDQEHPIIDANMLVHYHPVVERHIRFRRDLGRALAEQKKVVPFPSR